jgi:hypothetical protein
MFSSANLSLAAGKCARIHLSQADSCKHFQCQNRRFRVYEAGLMKDFLNNFKEASLNFEFGFFIIKKQKILKTRMSRK